MPAVSLFRTSAKSMKLIRDASLLPSQVQQEKSTWSTSSADKGLSAKDVPGDTKDKLMGIFSLADAMSKSCWLNLQADSQRLHPDEGDLRLSQQQMTMLFSECCEFDNFRTVNLNKCTSSPSPHFPPPPARALPARPFPLQKS